VSDDDDTTDDDDTVPVLGYDGLIAFWTALVLVPQVREALFSEIYFKTHAMAGERFYERYFSTVEALVCRGERSYYAHPDEVSYAEAGHTFLEDFLGALNADALREIVR
jgi:hypothetical protein